MRHVKTCVRLAANKSSSNHDIVEHFIPQHGSLLESIQGLEQLDPNPIASILGLYFVEQVVRNTNSRRQRDVDVTIQFTLDECLWDISMMYGYIMLQPERHHHATVLRLAMGQYTL